MAKNDIPYTENVRNQLSLFFRDMRQREKKTVEDICRTKGFSRSSYRPIQTPYLILMKVRMKPAFIQTLWAHHLSEEVLQELEQVQEGGIYEILPRNMRLMKRIC